MRINTHLKGKHQRLWQACAVLPELLLFAHMMHGSRRNFRQRAKVFRAAPMRFKDHKSQDARVPFHANFTFEPLHNKTNKMVSLGICPVWSESSLSAWRNIGPFTTYWAHSEDWSDWADAQADLILCSANMPFCWFCHAAAHVCFLPGSERTRGRLTMAGLHPVWLMNSFGHSLDCFLVSKSFHG